MGTVDISQIDKNFAAEEIRYEGLKIYNVKDGCFKLYGLHKPYEEAGFKRMPRKEAGKMNENIRSLYTNTSGGRIRFRTDSTRIFIRSILQKITRFDHMPRTGSGCFDLYVDGEYVTVFRHGSVEDLQALKEKPEFAYDSCITIGAKNPAFSERRVHDILIHFPLYNDVDGAFIGLDKDAVVLEPEEYTHTKPIVFYGSSITQGGCASHPGNCYANILSRRFDTDIVNLGFSSGAKGEIPMMEYLAGLDMGMLVYDYDHNSSLENLPGTHERGYQIIREKQPQLPIIIISAADSYFGIPQRKEIIAATYKNAVAAGDKNVYFIDGDSIYAPVGRSYCTVDNIHPNDIGFLMMANAIGAVVGKILQKGDRKAGE